jgi:hypothetical protein
MAAPMPTGSRRGFRGRRSADTRNRIKCAG